MKKELIGIFVCMVLITNASAVLGISKDKINSREIMSSNGNSEQCDKEEINYIILDNVKRKFTSVDISRFGPNLVPNPSFEEGDIMPSNWTFDTETNGIFNWDSNYSHSGEKSVGILNLTKYNYHYLDDYLETSHFIPIDSEENNYLYSCWFKFNKDPQYHQDALIVVWEYDENYSGHSGEGILGHYSANWSFMCFPYSNNNPETKYIKITLGQECGSPCGKPDPTVEVRFDDVFFGHFNNSPPETPTITGKTCGKVGTLYNYSVTTTDPDEDDVYYSIKCIPGSTDDNWQGPYRSGEEIIFNFTWNKRDEYYIKITAMDKYWGQSKQAILKVTISRINAKIDTHLLKLLDMFPILERILEFFL
jgi:hypothetical protein